MITEDKVTELFCMADDLTTSDPISGMSERFQSGILNQVVFLGETSGIAVRDNLSWKWHPAPLAGDLHEKGKRNILRARVI